MMIKVSDYIAKFLISKNIKHIFSVVGGGAMHMNNSFGHNSSLSVLYNHHEQASAMAAEAYARLNNIPAVVCVTSGPGAINALNGVIGAYQDSIPMLVFSGQTKTSLTVRNSGLRLRTLGNQEFDIISALENAVKFSEMIMSPEDIRYYLEKAYVISITGRMGPCWLDIPLDVQGAYVDENNLKGYDGNGDSVEYKIEAEVDAVIKKLKNARRPVLYAGNGIRLSGAANCLHKLAEKCSLPVVTCWDSVDLMCTEDTFYCGRGGIMGDRAGNFAVQNSDFLLVIGSRLNVYQVGYNLKTWARESYVVAVDIDPEELKKKTVRIDMPICCDAHIFMQTLLQRVENMCFSNSEWITQCNKWKMNYPVVSEQQKNSVGLVNVYSFMRLIGELSNPGSITVVSNGSACVVGSQACYIKKNDRFIMNCGISSMGYGLPAAIGVCVANNRQSVIAIEGDGSIMMNLQELQTISTNNLPIKLFIINNDGYHQIRQTQINVFNNGTVGVGPESHDLGFPSFKVLAAAFGIKYKLIESNTNLKVPLSEVLGVDGPIMCEVKVSLEQKFEPKSATKKLKDGSLYSPPLEDMAPFLPRDELQKNMYIPLLNEELLYNTK